MVEAAEHSTRLWLDLRKIGHMNLFKITRAHFRYKSGFPSQVKVSSWWFGVEACRHATWEATTDDGNVAMMPLRRSNFSTQVMKDCKLSLLKSDISFSNVACMSPNC